VGELSIYNTLTRKQERFEPIQPDVVTIYTCGPTVYDRAQIGNLRAFVCYDILVRTLAASGYEVRHVMNLTDVDDKTIRRSREEGIPLGELTQRYIDIFFEDLAKLNIRKAWKYPRATENIPQMVRLVKKLTDRGLTYESGGSVYFRIAEFPGYGKLSGTEVRTLRAGARVDSDEYEKEDASDFVLWKGWREEDGDVFWETEVGKGRPGWHIECSAMAMDFLGETVDMHGGGMDLVFPHHENEIAQSEGATGKPFVRVWVHNGWLLADGKKMSKSLGNYHVLEDIEAMGFDALDLRYFFLTNHYRQQFNFTREGIEASARARRRLVDFRQRLDEPRTAGPAGEATEAARAGLDAFRAALSDDLATPAALGEVHNLMGEANRLESAGNLTGEGAVAIREALDEMDEVLAVLPQRAEAALSAEEADLLEQRKDAREAKNFSLADKLRDTLKERGIVVEDTPSGQRWKRV
jgi:cysteinyl-tRNA synthetase